MTKSLATLDGRVLDIRDDLIVDRATGRPLTADDLDDLVARDRECLGTAIVATTREQAYTVGLVRLLLPLYASYQADGNIKALTYDGAPVLSSKRGSTPPLPDWAFDIGRGLARLSHAYYQRIAVAYFVGVPRRAMARDDDTSERTIHRGVRSALDELVRLMNGG